MVCKGRIHLQVGYPLVQVHEAGAQLVDDGLLQVDDGLSLKGSRIHLGAELGAEQGEEEEEFFSVVRPGAEPLGNDEEAKEE